MAGTRGAPYASRVLDHIPFHAATISYRTAALELRERLALDDATIAQIVARAAGDGRVLIPLSTCNRIECYQWEPPAPALWPWPDDAPVEYLDGRAAVRHLFAVAAGLQSQLVGETEILGQVRRAWLRARNAGASNLSVNLIFTHAITAGRRVRRETWLGSHAHSVMDAGVRQVVDGRAPGHVLVLGAGAAARGVLRALDARSVTRVTVICRRPEVAMPLTEHHDGWSVLPWTALQPECRRADLIIAATAAHQPVLTPALLGARPCTVLDLGVPRNVDARVRGMEGIRLVDLDDLRAEGCVSRAELFDDAWRIIDDELDRLAELLKARARAPQLTALHQAGARIAAEEAERTLQELGGLDAPDQALVRQLAERVARRVLFPASKAIRDV